MLPRRFTPNGQLLIAFGSDQKSVMAYRVNYGGNARHWSDFFCLQWEQRVAEGMAALSRECCLILGNGDDLLLVASVKAHVGPVQENPYRLPAQQLEEITLYLMCVSTGKVLDRFTLEGGDQVALSSLTSLREGWLAVTGLASQQIFVFWLGKRRLTLTTKV